MIIQPTKECFTDAMEYLEQVAKGEVRGLIPSLEQHRLIHAICRAKDQPELGFFAHAWVERDDRVIFAGIIEDDPLGFYNGERVWLESARDNFYADLSPQHIRAYTPREAVEWNKESGHLGPWEEPYTRFTRQGKEAAKNGDVC